MNGPDDRDEVDERNGIEGAAAADSGGARDDADWFDGGWDTIRRDGSVPPDHAAPDRAAADGEVFGDEFAFARKGASSVAAERPPAPAEAPTDGLPAGVRVRASQPSAGRRAVAGRGPLRGGEDGGRRLRPAGYVLITLFIGFGLASLLLAPKLASLAKDQPFGAKRDVLVALTKPLTAISSLLRLDKPAAAVESALGRAKSQEQSGLATRLHPSATPTSSGSTPPGGPTSPPGGNPPPGSFTPTRKNQLAMWVGGDSMAMIFGQSLVAMSQPTHVIDAVLDYKVSSGLSRPDFFNWPLRLQAQMKSFDPHVAVAMFGTNDGQSVQYQGKILQFGTPAWLALYHKRVGDAMDILIGSQHRQVWWVGLPIMRSGAFSKVIKVLDSVYKAEAATRPDVHWVDTYLMFADKHGRYQDYLPGPSGHTELMRQSDGIHFSRAGADMAANVVLDQIKAFWHIK
jgi:hypothetical protein